MKKFYIGAVGLVLSGFAAVFFLTGTAPEGWTDRGMAWGFVGAIVGVVMSVVFIATSLETDNFEDSPEPWVAPPPPPAPPAVPVSPAKPAQIPQRKGGARQFKFQEIHS